MKRICCILLCVLAAVPVFAQPRLSTDDLRLTATLSDLEMSPDGKRLLFIVTRQNFESDSFTRELLMQDIETKQQTAVRRGEGVAEPLWSPEGNVISYLAEKDGISQIFTASIDHPGEPRQVTKSAGGVVHHTWSPDGKWFAFLAEKDPVTKSGADKFNTAFEVGSNSYLTSEAAAKSYVGKVAVNGENAEPITPDGLDFSTVFNNSSLSWSPDGKTISVTLYPSSRSGDTDLGTNQLLDVNTKTMKAATNNKDKEGPALLSPDGKQIAFLYPRDGIPANASELFIAPVTGNAPGKSLTRNLDREVTDFAWMPDGRLLISGYDGLRSSLWESTGQGSWTRLDLGDVMEAGEFSAGKSGSIAFVGDELYRPSELYFKASAQAPPVRLTEFNAELGARTQGKREGFTWASTKGLHPDGVLTYPPDFNPGERYPLVLLIHGGPTAASTLAFHMTAQLMAAKGWIVFEPNYRGSNNQGNAFQSAIANDAGEGPGEDVMTGVQELKKKPFVDGRRVAVSGWSYGGWMTAWMIGRYPDAWAAAVAGAAPVDYTDMYSLSDLNRMPRHAITGSPYTGDNLQKAWDQSPIKNFWRIKTPTLVLSKTEDSRVAITGSYKLFNALRDNGVPTQFIAYPGPGHLVTDPVRAQDVYNRWLSWLERYLTAGAR